VNVNQRMSQWTRQCGSREQVLLGLWPGADAGPGGADPATLMRGRVDAGPSGKGSHRLERLVHLELADLVVNRPYLAPDWPNCAAPKPSAAGTGTPKKGAAARPARERCEDCEFARSPCFKIRQLIPLVNANRRHAAQGDLLVRARAEGDVQGQGVGEDRPARRG
jgi:hypothetical protein